MSVCAGGGGVVVVCVAGGEMIVFIVKLVTGYIFIVVGSTFVGLTAQQGIGVATVAYGLASIIDARR